MNPRRQHTATNFTRGLVLGLGLAVAAGIGAGLGPLNPPAGPVTETSPDLGDILSAVNGLGQGGACAATEAVPGTVTSGSIEIAGLATLPILELEIGASVPSAGGMVAPPQSKEIVITRVPDRFTPALFQRLCENQALDAVITLSDGATYRLFGATISSLCNDVVLTCEGSLHAERLTLVTSALEIERGGNSYGWNFQSNTPL